MEDFKTIFNFFDSIINGMHRPHLYNESLMPELHITYPTFKGYIDNDGSIHVEGLEGLFQDGDKLHLELDVDEENNALQHVTIKGICDDGRKDLIDIDTEPAFDDKTNFYEGLLEIAYSISCYRIEKHLLTPTTAEFKQSFSDSLVVYVRNLIANIDAYERSREHDPANSWVIKSTRMYLLKILAFICQKFDGYCRHNLKHHAQWEHELYPGKAVALKKIIAKFDPESKKETAEEPRKTPPQANRATTFKYIHYSKNTDAIPNLLDSLKKNNFVADSASIKEFRKIFNNEMPSTPIVWTGNKSELYYLIQYLHKELHVITAPQNKWQVVVEIFVDVNGQKFDAENLKGLKKPSTSNLLEIAANFLN